MPQKVKVGFIGAGTVGQMHISHWAKLPLCQVVGLADLRPELRDLVADKFGIPHSYNSHLDLLLNPEIEAVVVVTRRHNTAAVVDSCLQAGKHVFSEKPMAKTAEQANQLAQTANKLGLTYSVGYQRLHDAGTQIAKQAFDQLLISGELGKVTLVAGWNFTGQDRKPDSDSLMTQRSTPGRLQWPQAPSWLPDQYESAYDRFVNVCCHDVNMLRYFFNQKPLVRFANLDHKQGWIVVFDFDKFLSTLSGGFNELNDGGKPGQWDEGLEIIFEKGRLHIKFSPPLMHDQCSRVELQRIDGTQEILCSGQAQLPAFTLQAENFLHNVLQKKQSIAAGNDALQDIQLIEEIWQEYLKCKNQLT